MIFLCILIAIILGLVLSFLWTIITDAYWHSFVPQWWFFGIASFILLSIRIIRTEGWGEYFYGFHWIADIFSWLPDFWIWFTT